MNILNRSRADAVEAPKPNDAGRRRARKARFRKKLSDILFGAAGVGLAIVCLSIPWHVYLNPQQYGPPKMRFSRDGIVPGIPDDGTSNRRISVGPDLGEDPILDMIRTGTAFRDGNEKPPSLDEQPFPGDVDFELVFAVNGRALVSDGSNLFPVGIRSVLPDGSRVAAIRKTRSGWELVTTREKIVRLQE